MEGNVDYKKLKGRREELDITQKNPSEITDINLTAIKAKGSLGHALAEMRHLLRMLLEIQGS